MLSQPQRLRTDRAVRGTLRSGRRYRGAHLSVQIAGRTQPSRFAFVVSRKVSKSAVKRNQIRRRLQEIVRQLNIPAGDVVVIAFPSAIQQSYSQLQQELQQLLSSPAHARRPNPHH